MSQPTRPKRVVIVDADDPMTEIHGEFFWREDHDQILAEARQHAYEQGFGDGARSQQLRTPVLVTRRRLRARPRFWPFLIVLAIWTLYIAANWRH